MKCSVTFIFFRMVEHHWITFTFSAQDAMRTIPTIVSCKPPSFFLSFQSSSLIWAFSSLIFIIYLICHLAFSTPSQPEFSQMMWLLCFLSSWSSSCDRENSSHLLVFTIMGHPWAITLSWTPTLLSLLSNEGLSCSHLYIAMHVLCSHSSWSLDCRQQWNLHFPC